MDSRLIGRDDLLTALPEALESERWVSLVGPPGAGKTAVLRAVAHERDDVVWVDARGSDSLPDLLRSCLDGLGEVTAPADSPEWALTRALDGDRRWLVVDGVDLDGFDDVVADVMTATSEATVLTASSSLRPRPGRRVLRVAPFPVPGAHDPLAGPALDLFVRCVEHAGGRPVDLGSHSRQVRRLLQASGGLPLLLEQMAAQAALVGVARVAPPASLADAVDASYRLLEPGHRACFRRLALLSTPVGIEVLAAVTGVAAATGRDLALGLAARCLVEVLPDGRVDMLAPVRRCGAELADHEDAAAVRRGLVRWADAALPAEMNAGAGDAPWLSDLAVLRQAVGAACSEPASRDHGYALANRAFASLYTSLRTREAAELLETALGSGDGPPEIGAQVARRAGIAASETRGTYEGLGLLDRADEHAREAADPDLETARTASIRAEMHLDAGDLDRAEAEARRAVELDHGTDHIAPQATRTLAHSLLVRGDFARATPLIRSLLTTRQEDEPWLTLSARLLLARMAMEQGRLLEAATAAERVRHEARQMAEQRLAVLAEIELGHIRSGPPPVPEDDDAYPWAVRLPLLVAQASRLLREGHAARAAGRAADAVVLADSARLGRDALDARLLLGYALLRQGDETEARATLLGALADAAAMPAPLRAADALDALAHLASSGAPRDARLLRATSAALRAPRAAVGGGPRPRHVEPARTVPQGWVDGDQLTSVAVSEVTRLLSPRAVTEEASPLDRLTTAERTVAAKVAEGLTSRQIAAELFLSPRTVDAHLARIYRKLDIGSRARLAALVVDRG